MEEQVLNMELGRQMGRTPPAIWALRWRQRNTAGRLQTFVAVFVQKAQAERMLERCAKWRAAEGGEPPVLARGTIQWEDAA